MTFAGALRTVCTLGALLLASAPSEATDARHAIAGAYARGGFSVSYGVSADVALPEVGSNRSWYADWVMLVAKREEAARQPFIQLGEIRGLHPHDAPTAFIAYRESGRPVVFRVLRRVPSGEHRVAISGNGRTIRLALDQALVATFDRSRVFGSSDRVYAQYAAEVADPGDLASGSLRNLAIETDDDFGPRRPDLACLRYDRGVRVRRIADGFVPVGRFRPGDPSGFTDCDEALGRTQP